MFLLSVGLRGDLEKKLVAQKQLKVLRLFWLRG